MPLKPRKLSYLNFLIVGYFLLLWILFKWNLESSGIAFVAELLTIPMMLGLLVVLFLSIRAFMGGRRSLLLLISFGFALITAVLILLSFLL